MTKTHDTVVKLLEDLLKALRIDFLEASRRVRATKKEEKAKYRRIYNRIRNELIEAETLRHMLGLRGLASGPDLKVIKANTDSLVKQSSLLSKYADDLKMWRKRIKEFSGIIDVLIPLV